MSPAKKKATKPTASMPTGIYDLDKILGRKGTGRGGAPDDLDQILRDERRRQVDEIKGLQVDEIKLKMQKRVGDLKKQVTSGMGGITGVSGQELAEVTHFISQLPEAQRPIAIQALAAFRQESGSQMGAMAPMLMMTMLQKQPQMDLPQLVTALKGLNDIQGGNNKTDNVTMMMGMFKLMSDSTNLQHSAQMQLLRKEMEERNPYNPLEQTKSIMEMATSMGFKPGTGEVNVELEKVKMSHQTLYQKAEQEFQLMLKKMDRDDTRMLTFMKMFQKPLEALSVAGASKMTGATTGGAKQVTCPSPECGYSPIWITDDAPAICPKCKQQVMTEAYQQKQLAQQQQEAQAQQEQPQQQEERRPPPAGHVQV
jgi:hypothetical protein